MLAVFVYGDHDTIFASLRNNYITINKEIDEHISIITMRAGTNRSEYNYRIFYY